MRVALNELGPLKVSGHTDGATAQFLDGRIRFVRISLQNVGESIVRFLNLADHNGLELAPGVLEVEIGLIFLVCASSEFARGLTL